jgi:hypothetical protein
MEEISDIVQAKKGRPVFHGLRIVHDQGRGRVERVPVWLLVGLRGIVIQSTFQGYLPMRKGRYMRWKY